MASYSRAGSESWKPVDEDIGGFRIDWDYIDARECAVRKLQIQNDEAAEELRLADGSTVKRRRGESKSISSAVNTEELFMPGYSPE